MEQMFKQSEDRLVELKLLAAGGSLYTAFNIPSDSDQKTITSAAKPIINRYDPNDGANMEGGNREFTNKAYTALRSARDILTKQRAVYDEYRVKIDTKKKDKPLSEHIKKGGDKKTNATQRIFSADGESSSAGQGQSTSTPPDPRDAKIAELEAELARYKAAQATPIAEPAQLLPTVNDPNVVLDATAIDYTDATKEECVAALRKWAIDPKGRCHHLVREKGRQPRGRPVEDVRDRIDYANATKEQCIAVLKKWRLGHDGVHHHTGEMTAPTENQKRVRGQYAQEKCMFSSTEEVLNSLKSRLGNERKKWEKGDEEMQAFLVADKVKLKFTPCPGLGARTFIVHQSAGKIAEGRKTLEENQKARDGQEILGMLAAAIAQGTKNQTAKKK